MRLHYDFMVRTVNIRALKDKLSAYLRDVQRGDVVLVTDRGRVVAEIREPSFHDAALDAAQQKLQRLADRGALRVGLPNAPDAYKPGDVHLAPDEVDRALAWTRGDR